MATWKRYSGQALSHGFHHQLVRGMAVHRTTRANVRALGENGALISQGGINGTQISSACDGRFE